MIDTNLLSHAWEAYDSRKALNQQDLNVFCPDDPWEFNYLVDKLVSALPHLDLLTVMLAIRQGMRETMAPRPRQHFVKVVVNNLWEREQHLARVSNNMGSGDN